MSYVENKLFCDNETCFLIIAHNEPEILSCLLEKLSPIPGERIVHIDKKVRGKKLETLSTIIAQGGGRECSKIILMYAGEGEFFFS